jgi:Rrf2 family protein
MANLLRISEATTLALHTMALLARHGGKRFTNEIIAQKLNASGHHLAKVMQQLAKAGLVESQRGPLGGFRLSMPAKEVRLLRVFEVIEGPLSQGGCLLREPVCPGNKCTLGNLICRLQVQIHDCLANTTVADFSRDLALSGVSAGSGPAPRHRVRGGTAAPVRGIPRRTERSAAR